MRIIAGKFKRRPLVTAPGKDITRPTADRVKESIFNILTPYVGSSYILDLFAGSGALGLEALSRDATFCLFVEINKDANSYLQKNIDNLKIHPSDFLVCKNSVETFLRDGIKKIALPKSLAENFRGFEVIFADPPYDSSWYDTCIEQIENSGLCANSCLLILEMHKERKHSSHSPYWKKIDERSYGLAKIEIWERNGDKTD